MKDDEKLSAESFEEIMTALDQKLEYSRRNSKEFKDF
jgi:hypothetical protein